MNESNLLRRFFFALLVASAAPAAIPADIPAPDHAHAKQTGDAHVACVPVSERAGRKLGCFVVGTLKLGQLPDAPVYWHLYEYPARAAAESANGEGGKVVEALGKVWLFAIADAKWNASAGKRVARVGPLPVDKGHEYTAQFMEATFLPGMSSAVHRHAGPEAWYVLAGEQCLETPGHHHVVRAGESGIVPEGPPMQLFGIGKTERRSLVVILHDSSKPMTLPAPDWKSEGRCGGM
jgi:quercetin dioxygenase-like cupin family protein